jgi:PIN domain nuclease of toxin-antitoxin system
MIILDTHVLVWLTSDPEKLSSNAKREVQKWKKKGEIYVSSISVWEVAFLVKMNKLEFSIGLENWLKEVEDTPSIRFVSVDNKIVVDSIFLPGAFHKDPADRIIVATARSLNAEIITKDIKIRNYKYVQTVW